MAVTVEKFGYEYDRSPRIYWQMKGCFDSGDTSSHVLRMGKIQRYILENIPVQIEEESLLFGGKTLPELTPEQLVECEDLEKWYRRLPSASIYKPSDTGHRVLDYEKLLHEGVNGVLAQIERLQAAVDFSDPEDCRKHFVYTACRDALLGLLTYAEHIAQAYAVAAAEQTDPAKKARFTRLSEIFTHIPAEPARDFYEAMQSMWLLQYASWILRDVTLTGRPSDYLYPYYRQDKDAGIIDDEFVQLLINDLYIRHNDIYENWPASIMIGGVNRQGQPVWNELSYFFIKAIEQTKMVNPSVAVCYNEHMPADLMQLCVEMLAKGYTRPAFFNDEVIIRGLLQAGVSLEDARYYIHSTCVEITPIGTSHILVASPYININKAVEMALNNGKEIWGDAPDIRLPAKICTDTLDTYEKFLEAVQHAMSLLIHSGVVRKALQTEETKDFAASPLSSCFINDCLSHGKDCGAGGARYGFVYPCFPGFINLIDSVAAVKKVVYEEKMCTLAQMKELLATNFQGQERMRQYLLNRCPKFGNDEPVTDQLGLHLYEYIRKELAKYRTSLPNGTFHPSYFAWIMHGRLGKVSAASPDGRKQGTAMSESLGAAQGRDKNGPLAVIRSISKIDQSYGVGGIATNFRFSKAMMNTPAGVDAVIQLIHTFMAEGNFECQFNVVDQEILLDAKKNPENYKGLLVRVAGYSDYFVNLDPVIQDEVISRTEHGYI